MSEAAVRKSDAPGEIARELVSGILREIVTVMEHHGLPETIMMEILEGIHDAAAAVKADGGVSNPPHRTCSQGPKGSRPAAEQPDREPCICPIQGEYYRGSGIVPGCPVHDKPAPACPRCGVSIELGDGVSVVREVTNTLHCPACPSRRPAAKPTYRQEGGLIEPDDA